MRWFWVWGSCGCYGWSILCAVGWGCWSLGFKSWSCVGCNQDWNLMFFLCSLVQCSDCCRPHPLLLPSSPHDTLSEVPLLAQRVTRLNGCFPMKNVAKLVIFLQQNNPSWAGKISRLFNLIAMSFHSNVLQNLPISLFSRIGNFYFPPCRWIKRVFSAPKNPGQRATNTVFIPNSVHMRRDRAVQADRATSPQPKSWKLMR